MATLELPDGGQLEFDDAGSGQTIVLLHGWSFRKEAFALQLADLSQRFRVVVPDLRGHGRSQAATGDDAIPTLATDVEHLLDFLSIDHAVLVGWSMGAMVAWELALGPAAARVAGIVTIDMVPRLLNDDSWSFGLRAGPHDYDLNTDIRKMNGGWSTFAKAYVPKIFARGKGDERQDLIDRSFALVEHNCVGSMKQLWRAMINQDYRDRLGALGVPTLITFGHLSQLYDEQASVWQAEIISDARRVGFAESGHAPHLEEPELFNATLEQFAREVHINRNN